MAPRPKKSLKAKCAENQAALDRLAEKRASLGDKDRYSFTLKRAMESLQKCTEPITSHKAAMELKYVGSHCATIICPPTAKQDKNNAATRKRKNKSTSAAAGTAASSVTGANSNSNSSSPSSVVSARSTSSATAKRQRVALQAASLQLDKPTAKEVKYQKAVKAAEAWKTETQNLKWRVVLIIDARERKSEHMQAKCQMSGIPTEERHLPIGDMAWIAQGMKRTSTSSEYVVAYELMLGTIIERKTTEDLKSSIFGSRYAEQRLRLQHSGLPQVLFLVEGDMNKALAHCAPETLHTAVWETRLHLGFSIVQTAHMEDTVKTLKRMHRRILQRTFPQAFQQEALPSFQEAGVHSQQQRRLSAEEEGRRRRRRRLQSLTEMTFEMDPTLPLGMERFITYQELKAKIERDREAGTKTVGSIHLAMLKQVATVSDTKCHAIFKAGYSTTQKLMEAYHCSQTTTTQDAKKRLVTDVATHDGPKARNSKIGPRSSAELYVAYGVDDEEMPDTTEVMVTTTTGRVAATATATATAVGKTVTTMTTSVAALPPVSEIATGEWGEHEDDDYGADDGERSGFAAAPKQVPVCVDLLSPDRKPAAKKSLSLDDGDNLSMDSSNEKKAAAPSAAAGRTRKVLNTSLGSLLDSSDDESPLKASQRTQKATNIPQEAAAAPTRFSSDFDSSTEKKAPPQRQADRSILQSKPSNMDCSSDDDDGEASPGLGLSLRERMKARISSSSSSSRTGSEVTKTKSSSTSASSSTVAQSKITEVIEID